jgi:hypothetical protein
MIPSGLWSHISIEEINSLTEDETDVLLYICNVLYPIKLPEATEEHPITLNHIRYAQRNAIIGRVIQACSVVTEEGKEVYNGLRTKLGLPVPEIKEESKEILSGSLTGSNVQ